MTRLLPLWPSLSKSRRSGELSNANWHQAGHPGVLAGQPVRLDGSDVADQAKKTNCWVVLVLQYRTDTSQRLAVLSHCTCGSQIGVPPGSPKKLSIVVEATVLRLRS